MNLTNAKIRGEYISPGPVCKEKSGQKETKIPNQSFFEPLGVASWNDRLLIGGMDFRQQRFQAHTLGILS